MESKEAPESKKRCSLMCCKRDAVHKRLSTCKTWSFPPLKDVVVIILGLGSAACVIGAMSATPPHHFAGVLAAALATLSLYAYLLQVECERLQKWYESGSPAAFLGLACSSGPAVAGAGVDLSSLKMLPGNGTVQSVLTASLVNDYLHTASAVQKYQSTFGVLDVAPQNGALAEALLAAGLGQVPRQHMWPSLQPMVEEAEGAERVPEDGAADVSISHISHITPSPAPSPQLLNPRQGPTSPGAFEFGPSVLAATVEAAPPAAPAPSVSIEDSFTTMPLWLRQIRAT